MGDLTIFISPFLFFFRNFAPMKLYSDASFAKILDKELFHLTG